MIEKAEIPKGTLIAGRYRLRERLGEGGMGSVYLVEHVHTGQELALKVLNPKMVENTVALERFRRESRAPARIQSDHVVQVTDADVAAELNGAPFLVMELLRGESFDQLLAPGTIPVRDALLYLAQIARALDKAHQLGIVHRDIKPENLFLTRREDGTPCVKLLDFGIAKLTEGAPDSGEVSKTATGAIFGTPLYMAPEQILGRTDKVSGRTDVWALGIMAHRMLVGKEPWTAQTLPHLVAQIAYEPLPVPSDGGSVHGIEFDEWFKRCCAREPEDRFRTASDAVNTLASVLGAEPVISSSHHSVPRISSSRSPLRADALAETAVASSTGPAIGSDTLAAQVAPKKSSGPVVLAAFGVISLVGFGAYLALRTPAVKNEPLAQPVVPSAPPTTAPAVEPSVEPTLVQAPSASAAPTPGPSATVPPTPTKPVLRAPSAGGKKNPGKPDDDVMDSRK
jgi:serine/threonine-protein kinase